MTAAPVAGCDACWETAEWISRSEGRPQADAYFDMLQRWHPDHPAAPRNPDHHDEQEPTR